MTDRRVICLPPIELPCSVYTSAEAKRFFFDTALKSLEPQLAYSEKDIRAIRQVLEAGIAPAMRHALALFSVEVSHTTIGGVPVSIVTPTAGVSPLNSKRTLIELHPGGFIHGAGYGVVEAIPLAALGQIKVVCVQYRLAPEYQFPAATEDVATVYQAILQSYDPTSIGIYGSSAGGLLAAQTMEWLQRHRLPRPGGICISGASADAKFDGDSSYVHPASGHAPAPGTDIIPFMLKSYYGDADLKDPAISPVWSQEVLSNFPPTLILTSTRAHELSSAVFTHRELVRAGATTVLHVWEGVPHCFNVINVGLPESRDACEVAVNFFARHLSN